MADGAFIIMAAMLLGLVLTVVGAFATMFVAAMLLINPSTRSLGLRILLAGGVGILVMNIFVVVLKVPAGEVLITWNSAIAFVAFSLFGFACAGGIAAVVAVVVLIKRK